MNYFSSRRKLHHPVALGCAYTSRQTGDRINLRRGPQLTLVHKIDRVEIFQAKSSGGHPEMWTAHPDRPGIYVRVGEWPRCDAPLDVEEARKRAVTAHLIAETLFDLDHWGVS